jgi:transcriptional regulator GlxA family with amidase domain
MGPCHSFRYNPDVDTSKRQVGILIFDGVEVLDFAGPFEVFSRTRSSSGLDSRRSEETAPFAVFTIAEQKRTIVCTGGLDVLPRYSFTDSPPIDILVVPGGFGTRTLMTHQPTLAWIKHVAGQAELTTSVCTGALLLANAGLLRDTEVTTHWGALDLLESLAAAGRPSAGMRVDRGGRVIDTGRGIITSAGVASGMDMAFHVVEKLCGKDVADETAKYIEFRRVTF